MSPTRVHAPLRAAGAARQTWRRRWGIPRPSKAGCRTRAPDRGMDSTGMVPTRINYCSTTEARGAEGARHYLVPARHVQPQCVRAKIPGQCTHTHTHTHTGATTESPHTHDRCGAQLQRARTRIRRCPHCDAASLTRPTRDSQE
jgi:hypothetical protein